LSNLEMQMGQLLNQVRNGIKTLQNEAYLPTQPTNNEPPFDDSLL